MSHSKVDRTPARQSEVKDGLPLPRWLKDLRVYRLMSEMRSFGIVAPGFSVGWQTESADVLDLVKKLRPMDCGIELVRLGGAGDGGYLVPNDLDGIAYCFSPGVDKISNFENDLANRGINSFLADYSVDLPPIRRPQFIFDKKFVGITNNERFFTLASWKDKYLKDYAGELLLQMDIEGGEYQVIANVPDELLSQFRILVIEFHWLQRLFEPFAFDLLAACFEKILKSFYVVHVHPNNICGSLKRRNIEIPRIMEFTFLNKRRVSHATPVLKFPNVLDSPNIPDRRDLLLPECWYKGI
jgi:hypothetical protein